MPQLKSGRHVALSADPYHDALCAEDLESAYFAIVALRCHAATPESLCRHLVVGYFVEGEGTPPDAPSYDSGYCVADVLEGRSDWSPAEVEEFRHFIAHEPRLAAWLQAQLDLIDAVIRNHPIWQSEFMLQDPAPDAIDSASIKRAIIQYSALDSSAMAQLRSVRSKPAA